jgi:hypothetical protein
VGYKPKHEDHQRKRVGYTADVGTPAGKYRDHGRKN